MISFSNGFAQLKSVRLDLTRLHSKHRRRWCFHFRFLSSYLIQDSKMVWGLMKESSTVFEGRNCVALVLVRRRLLCHCNKEWKEWVCYSSQQSRIITRWMLSFYIFLLVPFSSSSLNWNNSRWKEGKYQGKLLDATLEFELYRKATRSRLEHFHFSSSRLFC